MKNLTLRVTSLRTDTDPVNLHYEVQVGEVTIIGDASVRKSEEPQSVRIAVVPDDADAALLTPDARLELIDKLIA